MYKRCTIPSGWKTWAGLLLLLASFSAFSNPADTFDLQLGETLSFDGLVLDTESSIRPYGPAHLVVEHEKQAISPAYGGVGIIDNYQLCEVASIDLNSLTRRFEKDMIFTVDSREPDPMPFRALRFFKIHDESGNVKLRIVCRQGVDREKVIRELKIVPAKASAKDCGHAPNKVEENLNIFKFDPNVLN